jgi:outer membrane protein TolC
VAVYQETVLRAHEEAENAIVAFITYHEQLKLLEQSVTEAEEAVRVAQAKYRAGRIDFNRVFTVEQLLVTQQDQLATAQGNLANSLIELYRALGGGWQVRL